MAKTVLGVFETVNDAERAVQELERRGFDRREISIVTKEDSVRSQGVRGDDRRDNMTSDVSGGVTTGSAIGGAAGLLASVGALAIPGIGPIVAAGPIAALLGGAVTGGIAGGLIDWGIPEESGRKYEERVREGKVVTALRSDDEKIEEAADILRRNGAKDVESH